MVVDLPRPDVSVTTGPAGEKHVVISREAGKAKSYRIESGSADDMIVDAVKKVISDPHSGEWLPRLTEREALYVSGNRKRRSSLYAK